MATIKYRGHCSDVGWQATCAEDGSICGTIGEHRALECYRIEELNIPDLNIHCFAYVQDYGWSAGNVVGEDCGSTGLGKHIEAVKMGLIGGNADKYDIFYRLHVQDKGFLNWSKNGEVNGTTGGNLQAEAIQIFVTEKGSNVYPVVDEFLAYQDLTPPPAPTPQPVDMRQKVLDTARSHLGYVSGTSNDSAFGRRYAGANAGSWCAYFVRAVMEDSGVDWYKTGYCPDVVSLAKRDGRWTGNPEPGFLVLYDFNGNGVSDHIGIVEKVYSSSHVVAIEANTTDGNGSPIGVYRRDRSYGILGYVNPY